MVLIDFINRFLSRFGRARPIEGATSAAVVRAVPATEQRLCPRRKYQEDAAPVLHVGKHCFKVIDLSKTGVRFLSHSPGLLVGDTLEGTIRVEDTSIRFRGAPIREDCDTGMMVVQFMQTEYLRD